MNRKFPLPNYKFTWIDGFDYKVLSIVYNVDGDVPMMTFVKNDELEHSNKILCISLMKWFNIVDHLDKFNGINVCIYE